MRIAHLALTDYRNYGTVAVDFEPGANLIVGRNGQGKTNMVEAIGYLSTLGSHRVASDAPLIRTGADAAIIRARLQSGERELLAELQINRTGINRAQLNRVSVKPRELVRYCHSVLFAPEDLSIVRGDPAGRRRYLDELLVQRTPRLAGVMADYDRVVRQRNTLLKSARSSRVSADRLGTLDIWDERLIALGTEIITERLALVEELRAPLVAAYQAVAGDDHVPTLVPALSIEGDDEIATRFHDRLHAVRREELDRAVTLVGPHRDDLILMLNDLPAKGYASHGESWSYALALQLASAELLRRDFASGDPVLILDDVFAELDQARRARLAEAVTGYEQVIITAAVFDDVPAALAGRVIRIEAGALVDG